MKGRQKFATQVDSGLLSRTRALAAAEGRQIQSVIDEALSELLEKRAKGVPRKHVMSYYQESVDQYGPLYELLAN